jgi:hypothetical protein
MDGLHGWAGPMLVMATSSGAFAAAAANLSPTACVGGLARTRA